MCTAVIWRQQSRDEGSVEVLFKIISWRLCVKAELPLGTLPPTGPLDYCTISPHALAESLGDIRAPISYMAALTLPPLPLTLTLKTSFCTVQACTCAYTHRYVLIWKLIRITTAGMWFDIVLSQWHSSVKKVVPCVSERAHVALHPHVFTNTKIPAFCSRPAVFFSPAVYFRNKFYKIVSLKRTFGELLWLYQHFKKSLWSLTNPAIM